jgi:small subunit ribosomal protein S16
MTNPATVELDVDQSVKWLRNGAQPSDTVRSLMSHKGVMLKHHLLRGVDKGAMTVEQAEAKFAAWLEEKTQKLEGTVSKINEDVRKAATLKLDAEAKVNKKRADELAKKLLVVEAPAVVEVAEEVVAETAAVEEVATEVAEVAEEAVAAEPEVEVAAELATEEETPAAE